MTWTTNNATTGDVPSVDKLLAIAKDICRQYPPSETLDRVRCAPGVAESIRKCAPSDVSGNPAAWLAGVEIEVDQASPPGWCELIYLDGSWEALLPGGGRTPRMPARPTGRASQ